MIFDWSHVAPMTPDELDDREAIRFERRLEELTKKYSPSAFCAAIAAYLAAVERGEQRQEHWPFHWMIHALEANCAYVRGHRDTPVTRGALVQVRNHFCEYNDPAVHRFFREDNLGGLAYILNRQQLELQARVSRAELARAVRLYILGTPLPVTANLFRDRYGLTFSDWVNISILVHSNV